MLISEAFELYRVEHIVYNNQSTKTEEMNGLAMKSLIGFCGDIDIDKLDFDMIRKWKELLLKKRGANTVRGYIIKVRVVFKHLLLHGHDVLNPNLIGIPARESKVIDFLDENEISSLIAASFRKSAGYSKFKRYRNRAIISALYGSGTRNSELCSLDQNQITNIDNTFTIIGKGNKPRLCFLDVRALLHIKEYLNIRTDSNPALFISEQNASRITPAVVQLVVKNAAKKAGISKPVHPHTIRHSFATNLLRNNTNMMYVSKFLGHTSIQTTQMYTHVVDEDLRKQYQQNHSF